MNILITNMKRKTKKRILFFHCNFILEFNISAITLMSFSSEIYLKKQTKINFTIMKKNITPRQKNFMVFLYKINFWTSFCVND